MERQTFLKPHFCGNAIQSDKLLHALWEDDLEKFKNLLTSEEKNQNHKCWAQTGVFLYYVIVRYQNIEFFKHIINMDNFNIDFTDSAGRSLLMNVALISSEKRHRSRIFDSKPISTIGYDDFALALIEKGTNIHLADKAGFTYLHMATTSSDNLKIGQLVIEKGVDVNAQADDGSTPLYLACKFGKEDWICMLLYYGADATIPCKQGILPLSLLSSDLPEELPELLWNYTFGDDNNIAISLSTLVQAMASRCSIFERMVKTVSVVDYDFFDLEYLCDYIFYCDPKHLKLFVKFYGYIVKDLLDNFPVLNILLEECNGKIKCINRELKQIIDVFLQCDYIAEFLEISDPEYPLISNFVEVFNFREMVVPEEEMFKDVCLMLSYGSNITSKDLDTVHKFYGESQLFRIMSQMNVNTQY